jgi:pilus assembly protein CpaC
MSGSTIILGGLISQDDTSKVKKVPFLGDLPLIGELFRSTKFRKGESEVIVLVQAWIVTEEMLKTMQTEKQPLIEEHKLKLEDAIQEVREAK